MSDIEVDGIAEGAIAGGGADGGGGALVRGPELYGVSPGPPGFGPGTPMALPPDGLAGWAQTGAENASAAITATPVMRCFISAILPLGLQLDMVERVGGSRCRVSSTCVQMVLATRSARVGQRIIGRWMAADPATGFHAPGLRPVLAAASLHSFNSRAERSLSGRPFRITEHVNCLLDTQFPHSEARRGDPDNI